MSVREKHYIGYGIMFEDYEAFQERFGENPDDAEDEDSLHLDVYREPGEVIRLVEDNMGCKYVFVGKILAEADSDKGEGLVRMKMPELIKVLDVEYLDAMRKFGIDNSEAVDHSHFFVWTHYR